ncbi:MAG: hypothetical protein KC593_21370, partial [Myxococcales bacterium]|nr:hypothetical protein [Myxococcales bacterium]
RLNVDRGWLGSELGVRAWLPAEAAAAGGGRVRGYQLDVRALGCAVGAGLRGCLGAFAGVMPARGEGVTNAKRGVGVAAGLALALGYDRALGERVSLGLRVAADVPLLRPSLQLNGAEVWQGAPVSVLASIGVGVRLR